MRNRLWMGCLGFVVGFGPALAQVLSPGSSAQMAELASLRQELTLLQQRVGELSMSIEQLNRDNASLQEKLGQNFATMEQLNRAVADINRATQAALTQQKQDVLGQVAASIGRLATQTQAAIDAVARNQATRPAIQTTFSDNYPKEGVSYTVRTGDTLDVIAKRNNSRVQDIINANKISDPSKIFVGQSLFIPQGK